MVLYLILKKECKIKKYSLGLHDHKNKKKFDEYFNYTNLHLEEWNYIIRQANSINNTVEIIRKLESSKIKITILTKTHALYEMEVKVDDSEKNIKL